MQNLMLFSVVFVLAFVITAQFFWFLHYMSKEGNIFTVTKEGLPEQSQKSTLFLQKCILMKPTGHQPSSFLKKL